MCTMKNITCQAKDISPLRDAALNLAEQINSCMDKFDTLHDKTKALNLDIGRNAGEGDIEFLKRLAIHLTVVEQDVSKSERLKKLTSELDAIKPTDEVKLDTNRQQTKLGRVFQRAANLLG